MTALFCKRILAGKEENIFHKYAASVTTGGYYEE
jgi:hypothetical protein